MNYEEMRKRILFAMSQEKESMTFPTDIEKGVIQRLRDERFQVFVETQEFDGVTLPVGVTVVWKDRIPSAAESREMASVVKEVERLNLEKTLTNLVIKRIQKDAPTENGSIVDIPIQHNMDSSVVLAVLGRLQALGYKAEIEKTNKTSMRHSRFVISWGQGDA